METRTTGLRGLVRFAWREALRPHDRLWFQKGENYDPVAPDLTPNIAASLGGKPFLIASGKFSDFADAQTLRMYNAEFVGRDRKQAKPGDLLFFHQPWVQKYPFHVMIFLGEPRIASEGTGGLGRLSHRRFAPRPPALSKKYDSRC